MMSRSCKPAAHRAKRHAKTSAVAVTAIVRSGAQLGVNPRGDKPRGDRPFNDKPRGDRPRGDGPRSGPAPRDGARPFRKDGPAPSKHGVKHKAKGNRPR